MRPVTQQIVDKGYGDCMRSTVASLLELPMEAVPHFLACKTKWHTVLIKFFEAYGYNWAGNGYSKRTAPGKIIMMRGRKYECGGPRKQTPVLYEDSIGGFFYATVPSKNYRNTIHAVVMDMNGFCAHDPSPLGLYQDQQILKNGIVESWMTFEKR